MKFLFLLLLNLYLLQIILSEYDPNKAIAYAKRWALDRNPRYHDYTGMGDDCANFVSQCLIEAGFSTSGCEGNYGIGETIPMVTNLEKCLVKNGWTKYTSMPSVGIQKGSVIIFNSNQYTALVVQGGTSPLIAGHNCGNDQWMAPANWGTKTYFTYKPSGIIPPFRYVNGYDTSDRNNGYAGDFGKPIIGLKIKSGTYTVHIKDGNWLSAVKNNRIAGNGKPIDGIAIKGGVIYRVHIMGGGWLPAVNGYDFHDDINGYAGILGRAIDAISIKGNTYGVAN